MEGGKKGYEVIERFLNAVSNFLKPDGIILTVFSSLTKKEKVDEFIKNNLLESELLEKQHIFFEDLFVYKIEKSSLLKTLERNNVNNIRAIRSVELVAVAYELGILDSYITKIPDARKNLLESVLWGVKLNGCAVSKDEIGQILRIEAK